MKNINKVSHRNINSFLILFGTITIYCAASSCANNHSSTDSVPSLAKAYSDYFSIGVSVALNTLEDSMDRSMIVKHFNSITSENYMKWEFIHPEPNVYDFEKADQFMEFGEANNLSIVGHVLVWHSQTPAWVFHDESGNAVSREILLERMKDHINTVVGRYKGRIACWDVVNEAIGDDGKLRENIWYQIIGEDYIEKAFQYASEADPNAILIYNDYSLPTPEKRNRAIQLIKEIQANGTKINGVGLQGHYHLDYPKLEDLDDCITAFGELGLKVMFTELDINVLPKPSDYVGADISKGFKLSPETNPFPDALPDSMQVVLAKRYADFFTIFINHKDIVSRVTFWGIHDGRSWKNNWPIRGRTNYPLLFDRQYQPKKAFWEVIGLVEKE